MPERVQQRKLARIPQKGWEDIGGGVCAGFAYYFGWSLWLVRFLFFIFTLNTGELAFIYLLLCFFMDEYKKVPDDFEERTS